jgi:hypothetical protein
MKNIALCIHGYFSNKSGDDLLLTNYIYDNIINKINKTPYNLQIFIHSFDVNNSDAIKKKYPVVKKYMLEEQIDFKTKLDIDNKDFINIFDAQESGENAFNTLSFLYSRKMSIELALNDDISYDLIICSRFDVGIRNKILEPDGNNCCNLEFQEDFVDIVSNSKYIVSSFWRQLNAGFADYWFFSNLANMKILALMYDDIINFAFKNDSDYLKMLLNDWIYSNKDNEFSNECLDLENYDSTKNTKYLLKNASNNHLLHKYYFLKSGLFFKSIFLKNDTLIVK